MTEAIVLVGECGYCGRVYVRVPNAFNAKWVYGSGNVGTTCAHATCLGLIAPLVGPWRDRYEAAFRVGGHEAVDELWSTNDGPARAFRAWVARSESR